MPKYYYRDASNKRQGPYNVRQLQALVEQGIVGPKTPLETESGPKGTAGQFPALFNTSTGTQNIINPWAIGVILAVVGLVLLLYGSSLNNSLEAQLRSAFNSDQVNPGTVCMIIGGVALGFGVILAIADLTSNKK